MKFSDSGVRPQGRDPGQEDGSKGVSVSAGHDEPGRFFCDDVFASCHMSPPVLPVLRHSRYMILK